MTPDDNPLRTITRRHFFRQTGFGIGTLALASLRNERTFGQTLSTDLASATPLTPRATHFAPRAKNIIFLFMAGGPSQMDLFDPKPKLNEFDGQPAPPDMIKGERFAFITGKPRLLGSPHAFKRYGQCGAELSNLLPHLSTVVDDVAFVRSLHTN